MTLLILQEELLLKRPSQDLLLILQNLMIMLQEKLLLDLLVVLQVKFNTGNQIQVF